METKTGLIIVALLAMGFFGMFAVYVELEPATRSEVATPPTETRIITVAGTGQLEAENGKFFVRATCQLETALGAIDEASEVRDGNLNAYGSGWAGTTDFRTTFVGKRVTVIADVEVAVDDESVFRPVRTVHLTIFRHSDGLPNRSAQ